MTALTGTQFISEAIQYGGVSVENSSEDTDKSLVWLNRAISNRHSEVCNLMNKWLNTTGVVDSTGYLIDVPADWDWIAVIEVYTDENRQNLLEDYSVQNGKIQFDSMKSEGQTFYLRYRQAANRYTAIGDSIVETANPRLLSIIMDEYLAIFFASDNDQDESSQESGMLRKADQNS